MKRARTSTLIPPGCSAHPTTKVSGLHHGDPREVVWNFPLGVTYKSTNAYGWPRLIVSVYGTDMCNRRIIKGYGSVHVPCSTGRHEREIRLFKPVSSSWIVRFRIHYTKYSIR